MSYEQKQQDPYAEFNATGATEDDTPSPKKAPKVAQPTVEKPAGEEKPAPPKSGDPYAEFNHTQGNAPSKGKSEDYDAPGKVSSFIGSLIPEGAVRPLEWAEKHIVHPPEVMATEGGHILRAKALDVLGEETASDEQYEALANNPLRNNILRAQAEKEHPIISGVVGGAAELGGNIIADPRNWPMMGAGAMKPVFKKLLAGGFGTLMAKGTAEGVKDLYDNWGDMTPEQRSAAITKLGLSAYFTKKAADEAGVSKPITENLINPTVRGGAKVADVALKHPRATGAIAGTVVGGPIGGVLGAGGGGVAGTVGGHILKSVLPEGGMPESALNYGLEPAQAKTATAERALNAAQKEFNKASSEYDAHFNGNPDNVPPKVADRLEAATKELQRAKANHADAKAAAIGKPAEVIPTKAEKPSPWNTEPTPEQPLIPPSARPGARYRGMDKIAEAPAMTPVDTVGKGVSKSGTSPPAEELIPSKPSAARPTSDEPIPTKTAPEAKPFDLSKPVEKPMGLRKEGAELSPEALEAQPSVRQKVFELGNEDLDKLARAHGIDPSEPQYSRSKEMRGESRRQTGREKLANDIVATIGDDEMQNLGRAADGLKDNPDMASKAVKERAKAIFPRLRGPVDEFGNPRISGGAPEAVESDQLISPSEDTTGKGFSKSGTSPPAQRPTQMNPKYLREWLKFLWQDESGFLKIPGTGGSEPPATWKGTPEEWRGSRRAINKAAAASRPAPIDLGEGENPWITSPEEGKWTGTTKETQAAAEYRNRATEEEHDRAVQTLVDRGKSRAEAERIVSRSEKELIPARTPEALSKGGVTDTSDQSLVKIADPNSRFSKAIKKTIKSQGVPADEVDDIAMDVLSDFINEVRSGWKPENAKVGSDISADVGSWLNTAAKNRAIDWMREGTEVPGRRVDDVVHPATGEVIEHGTGRTLKRRAEQLPEDHTTNANTGKIVERQLIQRGQGKLSWLKGDTLPEESSPVSDSSLKARALREHLATYPQDAAFLNEVQSVSGHGGATYDTNFRLSRENAAAIGKKFGLSAAKVRERLGDISRSVQSRYFGETPTPRPFERIEEGGTPSPFGRITTEKAPTVAKPTETYGHAEGFAQGTEKATSGEVREDLGAGRTLPLIPPTEAELIGRFSNIADATRRGELIPSTGTARAPVDLDAASRQRLHTAEMQVQEAQDALDGAKPGSAAARRAKAALEDAKDRLNLIRNKPVSGGSQGAMPQIDTSNFHQLESQVIPAVRREAARYGLELVPSKEESGTANVAAVRKSAGLPQTGAEISEEAKATLGNQKPVAASSEAAARLRERANVNAEYSAEPKESVYRVDADGNVVESNGTEHSVKLTGSKGEHLGGVRSIEYDDQPNVLHIVESESKASKGSKVGRDKGYAKLLDKAEQLAQRRGVEVTVVGDKPGLRSEAADKTWRDLKRVHGFDVKWNADGQPSVTFTPRKPVQSVPLPKSMGGGAEPAASETFLSRILKHNK